SYLFRRLLPFQLFWPRLLAEVAYICNSSTPHRGCPLAAMIPHVRTAFRKTDALLCCHDPARVRDPQGLLPFSGKRCFCDGQRLCGHDRAECACTAAFVQGYAAFLTARVARRWTRGSAEWGCHARARH